MSVNSVPVLHKEPSDKESLALLKQIDSRLEDVPNLYRQFKNKKKTQKDEALLDIQKEIASFEAFKSKQHDVSAIPKQYLDRYIKLQTTTFKKITDNISDSIEDYTNAILSKKGELSKTDLQKLEKVAKVQQEYESKNGHTAEDPLADLKETIAKFIEPLQKGVDVSGLSKQERKEYLKNLNSISEDQRHDIKDTIEATRKEILTKTEISEQDKVTLKQLNDLQSALKEYGVEQVKHSNKVVSYFSERLTRKNDELVDYTKRAWKQGSTELTDSITTGLLGPLNLILGPLSETFGLSFSSFLDTLTGKDKKEYTKKGKVIKARRADVLKSNPEIVYLADTLTKDQKVIEDKDKTKPDLMSQLGGVAALGSLVATLVPFILPALGITVGVVALGALVNKMVQDAEKRKAEGKEIISDIEKSPEKKAELEKRGIAIPSAVQGAQLETKKALGSIASGKGYEADISKPEMIAGTGDIENIKVLNAAISDKENYRKQLTSIFGSDPLKTKGLYWMLGSDGKYYVSKTEDMSQKYQWVFDNDAQKEKIANYNKTDARYDSDTGRPLSLDEMLKNGVRKFHEGGFVPGNRNQEIPAILKGREQVLTEENSKKYNSLLERVDRKTKGFDSINIGADLSIIAKQIKESINIDGVINKLNQLIQTIEKKPFNNVVSVQPQATNFDLLRGH